MLRLIAICLLLSACGTDTIELVRDAGARDATPQDATPEDATPEDAMPQDATSEDTGPADAGMPDLGTPDTGLECVCRIVMCVTDPDCAPIGSTCDLGTRACTRSIGSCTTDSECGGPEWRCTTTPDSLDPC